MTLEVVAKDRRVRPDPQHQSPKKQPSNQKQPSSPKKQISKSTTIVPSSYLEILGNEAPTSNTDSNSRDNDDDVAQLVADKQRTLARAMQAAKDGDAEEASYLFRLHSKMTVNNTPEINTVVIRKPAETKAVRESGTIDLTNDVVVEQQDEKPFVENGITFMPGMIITT